MRRLARAAGVRPTLSPASSSGPFRFLTLVALALSMVGLYAVTTHAVSQRAQEIGVRVVFGFLGTMAWDALFFSGRANLRFASAQVLGSVALLLIVISIAACAIPMRRVIRLNPVAVLRED